MKLCRVLGGLMLLPMLTFSAGPAWAQETPPMAADSPGTLISPELGAYTWAQLEQGQFRLQRVTTWERLGWPDDYFSDYMRVARMPANRDQQFLLTDYRALLERRARTRTTGGILGTVLGISAGTALLVAGVLADDSDPVNDPTVLLIGLGVSLGVTGGVLGITSISRGTKDRRAREALVIDRRPWLGTETAPEAAPQESVSSAEQAPAGE